MQNVLPYIWAAMAIVLYAALTPLAKKIQINVPPFAFIAVAMGLLAILSLALSFFLEKEFSFKTLSLKGGLGLILFGFINLIAFYLYLKALAHMPSVNYCIMSMATPLIVAVISYFLLQEVFTLRQFVGILIVFVGILVSLSGEGGKVLQASDELPMPITTSQKALNKAS